MSYRLWSLIGVTGLAGAAGVPLVTSGDVDELGMRMGAVTWLSAGAGMAAKSGPMSGTNSARPAMNPSARAEGTPISHRASPVQAPTKSIAIACPDNRPTVCAAGLRTRGMMAGPAKARPQRRSCLRTTGRRRPPRASSA